MNQTARNRQYLEGCKQDLERARESGQAQQLSLSLANYAYALTLNNRFEEAMDVFNQAEVIAGSELEDIRALAHGLGLRALVYQENKRLPDAYRTITKTLQVVNEEEAPDIECDALATQGQILLDSGNVDNAFQRFQEAETLASSMGDQRRLMKIKGALANLSLSVPALQESERYYRQAMSLAEDVGDIEAQKGFAGNLGSVLEWQGKYDEALEMFQKVLPFYEDQENLDMILKVLKKMVHCADGIGDNERVFKYGYKGLEYLEEQESNLTFEFLEPLILAYLREGKVQEAHNMISDAITIARSMDDMERELEFLMNLGESFVAEDMLEQARDIYQDALRGARKLENVNYEAYLQGRLGYVSAELGQLDQAVEQHLQAIGLAAEHNLASLKAEQHAMLAMAYEEQGQIDRAVDQAQKANEIFELAEVEDGKRNARRLLQRLKEKQTV